MLNLVLDIGNTRCKWGLFQKSELKKSGHLPTQGFSIPIELKNTNLTGCLISGSGEIPELLHSYAAGFKNSYLFSDIHHFPIELNYKTLNTLGTDRIANAIAAKSIFPNENCLIIDAGTCITLDFLDSTSVYQGGSIHPGIEMRYKALNTFTASLPLIKAKQSKQEFPGKSTEESIVVGVENACLAEIEAFIAMYEVKYPQLKIIFTGGDAKFFVENIKNNTFAEPNLGLLGLNSLLNFHANI